MGIISQFNIAVKAKTSTRSPFLYKKGCRISGSPRNKPKFDA